MFIISGALFCVHRSHRVSGRPEREDVLPADQDDVAARGAEAPILRGRSDWCAGGADRDRGLQGVLQ